MAQKFSQFRKIQQIYKTLSLDELNLVSDIGAIRSSVAEIFKRLLLDESLNYYTIVRVDLLLNLILTDVKNPDLYGGRSGTGELFTRFPWLTKNTLYGGGSGAGELFTRSPWAKNSPNEGMSFFVGCLAISNPSIFPARTRTASNAQRYKYVCFLLNGGLTG